MSQEPGIYAWVPFEKYKQWPYPGNSSLKELAKSPAAYQYYLQNGKTVTSRMTRGAAVDCLVFEPKEFDNRYTIMPPEIKVRRGKKWDEFKATVGDREVLTAAEHDNIAAIARAMLNRPSLILADEPTGNLDPENADRVIQELARYHRQGGTVIVVTHGAAADAHADRVIRLRDGRLEIPSP